MWMIPSSAAKAGSKAAFTLTASMQSMFFDREAVIKKIGKANARRLSRVGAYIRKRAKTDILRRKSGTSSPGSPPHVHSRDGTATLKNVQFALDRVSEAVMVGPIKLNQVEHSEVGSTTVPERLEFGGRGVIHEERYKATGAMDAGPWRRSDQRRNRRTNVEYRKRAANYLARPFMGPALKKEIAAGTLQGLFSRVG